MIEVFQKRLAVEKKKASMTAWMIDFFFLYYFMFAVYFLSFVFQGVNHPSSKLEPGVLLAFFPLALFASFLWSKFGNSAGNMFVYSTNSFLKGEKQKTESLEHKSWLKSFTGMFCLITLVVTLFLGVSLTEMSMYSLLSEQGISGAKRIFMALFNPEMDIIGLVLSKMLETIFIAFMATALAIPIAFVGSFFCARNLTKNSASGRLSYTVLRFIFNFTRSVEPIIWAIIFSVWVGIGPFAGMLALMLHSVSSLAKLYSEQIENIDRGPLEAIEATGANKIQVVWHAVVPQIVLPYLSFTIYRWDINIRMATIIGLVGGGGVGTLLMQYQGLAQWNEVGTIVIVIALVVWIMDYLSARIREAIL